MAASVEKLREKIRSRTARTGVVGLGYVGLPLAVELAKAGFHATGIDLDARKVDSVNDGRSYIPDVATADVQAKLALAQRLQDEQNLSQAAAFAAVGLFQAANAAAVRAEFWRCRLRLAGGRRSASRTGTDVRRQQRHIRAERCVWRSTASGIGKGQPSAT